LSKRVLIVEDEVDILDLYSNVLEKEGFEVLTAIDGDAGLQLAIAEKPDIILLDILLPKKDGIAVLRELREKGVQSKVVILTASPILHVQEGVRLGIHAYLNKTISTPKEIATLIREATEERAPDEELEF
jgi:two-component system, OmpR family, alkaline phosphatase synthesis response regulator PhoP